MAEDAGALLVRSGLIAEDELLLARQARAAQGGTLGEHLVLAGFAHDEALAEFYQSRLMVPRVAIRQLARIGREIIAKIPANMATEFRCVPVSLDRDGNLTVAMADPSTTHAVDEIGFYTGYYIVRAVATQSQIAWSLAHYYGRLTPLGERLLHDSEGALIPGPMPPLGAFAGVSARPASAAAPRSNSAPSSISTRVRAARHHAMTPVLSPFRKPPSETPMRPVAADESWLQNEPTNPHAQVGKLAFSRPTPEERQVASSPIPVLIEEEPVLSPYAHHRGPKSRQRHVVSFLHGEEDNAPTGPLPPAPLKRQDNTPDLSPRSGEVHVPSGPINLPEALLPAVLIALPDNGDSARTRDPRTRDPRTRTDDEMSARANGRAPRGPEHMSSGTSTGELLERAATEPLLPDDLESGFESGDTSEFDDIVTIPNARPIAVSNAGRDMGPGPDADVDADADADADAAAHTSDRPLADARARAAERPSTRRRHRKTIIGLGIGTTSPPPEPISDAIPEAPVPSIPTVRVAAPVMPPRTISVTDSLQKAAEAAAEAHARARETRSSETPAVSTVVETDADTDTDTNTDAAPRAPVPSQTSDRKPGTITNEPTARLDRAPASIVDETGDDDDEWGPPGTTIPPPFLGAMAPGDDMDDGVPHSDHDITNEVDVPLMPLPERTPRPHSVDERSDEPSFGHSAVPMAIESPAAKRRDRSSETVQAPLSLYDSEDVTPKVLREFENSQEALAEVLRHLQLADTRDAVIDILVEHLHKSHQRVAFFAVRAGRLEPFKLRGSRTFDNDDLSRMSRLWLRLDFSSTFQDIVGTRLPFRGPITDKPSSDFIVKTFGSVAEHMLGLPVTVRERVVGVLYGDTGKKRVFVENLGVMARAAGGALERIIKIHKG